MYRDLSVRDNALRQHLPVLPAIQIVLKSCLTSGVIKKMLPRFGGCPHPYKGLCGLIGQTRPHELRPSRCLVLGVLRWALSVVEMCQEALAHGRSFDGDNVLHLPATGFAGLDFNREHALPTLRPGHCRVAVCRGLTHAHRVRPSASGRGHLLMPMMVGGEYALIPRGPARAPG